MSVTMLTKDQFYQDSSTTMLELLNRLLERNRHQAEYYDALTSLPNRRYLFELIKEVLNNKEAFSIIQFDINHFSEINNSYGYEIGDQILKEISTCLKENRYKNEELIARIGNDEFVIVCQKSSVTEIEQNIDTINDLLNNINNISGFDQKISVTFGAVLLPNELDSLSDIFSHLDIAMYGAKNIGVLYKIYNQELGFKYLRELTLYKKLKNLDYDKNLYLVYQPVVDLKTERIIGLETLLRWQDPELGLISPMEFIPIAEKHFLMNDIGNWILVKACKQLKLWLSSDQGFTEKLAINISVQQMETPEFVGNLLKILDSEQVKPHNIVLEITESLVAKDTCKILDVIKELVDYGFHLSIDDFGTGYSSLAYLKNFHAKTIKVDKAFVDNIVSDSNDQAIVRSVTELGHNLGLEIIAEGIETEAQKDFLLSIGCDKGQGYFFSKPISAELITQYLGFKYIHFWLQV